MFLQVCHSIVGTSAPPQGQTGPDGYPKLSVDVFLSVGRSHNDRQERMVSSLEKLRVAEVASRTAGRSDFSSTAPLERMGELLDRCHGSVVLAFTCATPTPTPTRLPRSVCPPRLR